MDKAFGFKDKLVIRSIGFFIPGTSYAQTATPRGAHTSEIVVCLGSFHRGVNTLFFADEILKNRRQAKV